jgi:hypothetical protein
MSGVRRVLRWDIAIDDQDHDIDPSGPVLHVAGHRHHPTYVEVWTLDPSDEAFWNAPIGTRLPAPGPRRVFRVFGTGQAVPAGYVWRATAERTADGLVWHLFERTDEPAPSKVVVSVDLSGGDEALVAALRRAIRTRGGSAQAVLGSPAAKPDRPPSGPSGVSPSPDGRR